ncbi:MAG: hypothetical protein NTV07_05990, partial [Candidatus Omnitrophica bacterium]|nr:hypothetical protein [Candidatus Omnitrophota bacterium]
NFSGIKEFNGVEMTLARTHKHPLPTYGFKIKTPSGTVAYLVDSVMPLKTDPYYNEFVEFFGGKDVDILIAENGVPPIHITPDQLAGTFPELAAAGRILTVHSAFQQAHKDLLRLNAFEPVKIETRTGREIYVQRLAEELSRLNAIPQLWKLTPEACRRFAVSGHEIVLEEGAVIYGEGNSPEEDPYVYVLLEGKINVVGVPVDIKPGSIIGEMAIMRKEIDPAMIKIESGLTIREKRNRAALRRLLDGGIPGLIKEEMIGGEKHYIWEITQWDDEAEQACRGKNATEDNKKFLRELFATAVNPPRNKTVVAEGQTRLLRVHKDTFVKLCASIDIREAVPGAKTRQLAALVAKKYIDERLQARAVEDLFNGINTAAIRHGNPPTSRDVAGALQTQRGCLENI